MSKCRYRPLRFYKPSAVRASLSGVLLCGLAMALPPSFASASHVNKTSTAKPPLPAASTRRTLLPAPFTLPWDANTQGQFIMSMTGDRQGHVWVGTEDQGVWRFDRSAPAGKQWTQFTSKDGLGDNDCYALTCDRLGRVWAGTLNHGVSVFNGKDWKTYGPVDGPLGSRVFALATSPKDGDVWMSTEEGLARYSLSKNAWSYYTRVEGLPSNQAQALAFNQKGDLFVGTDCDGIAIGSAANAFKTWHLVPGPATPPDTARGDGLPSGLINALLVARNGIIYAGTTTGLAQSGDSGRTWRYTRGVDWLDKSNGRFRLSNLLFKDNPKISGLEVIPTTTATGRKSQLGQRRIAIAAGSPVAVGRFSADHAFTGGTAYTVPGAVVDTRGVPAPAPPSVYRSERWGSFAYLIPCLVPGARYRVRLHFAEMSLSAPGKRVFGMRINGETVLSDFDIFAATGGANKATVKEFTARADFRGQILIQSDGGTLAAPPDPHLLAEDYVTALAEDAKGQIWIGHRAKGYEIFGQNNLVAQPLSRDAIASDYIQALLPLSSGKVLLGRYGGGITWADLLTKKDELTTAIPTSNSASQRGVLPPLPMVARPPTVQALRRMFHQVQSIKSSSPTEKAVYLGEDWQTQGDWLGRYGRAYNVLCAMASPFDQQASFSRSYHVDGKIGPHHSEGDYLRAFGSWPTTDNPKSLYSPVIGHRRQSEWDDHGETYPVTYEGPDVWVSIALPTGTYRISMYFMNKDGHDTFNRYRDYLIELKGYAKTLEEAQAMPSLASARVTHFWGSVYKQFVVRGGQKYYIRIGRNYSINTILSAVMVDKLAGPAAKEDNFPEAYLAGVDYSPPTVDNAITKNVSISVQTGNKVWSVLNTTANSLPKLFVQQPYRLLDYRAAHASGAPSELLANWRWRMNIWTDEDRHQFRNKMAEGWEAQNDPNPRLTYFHKLGLFLNIQK